MSYQSTTSPCGTFGVGDYTRDFGQVPLRCLHLHGGRRDARAITIWGVHVRLDCHMNYNMKSILANSDPIVTFIHQMIPPPPEHGEVKTNTLDANGGPQDEQFDVISRR